MTTMPSPEEPNFVQPGTCGTCRHWSLKSSGDDAGGIMRDWGYCQNETACAVMKPTGADNVRYALRMANASQELVDLALEGLSIRFESQFGCRFWEGDVNL